MALGKQPKLKAFSDYLQLITIITPLIFTVPFLISGNQQKFNAPAPDLKNNNQAGSTYAEGNIPINIQGTLTDSLTNEPVMGKVNINSTTPGIAYTDSTNTDASGFYTTFGNVTGLDDNTGETPTQYKVQSFGSELEINLPTPQNLKITRYNTAGQLVDVSKYDAKTGTVRFSFNNQTANGIYLVTIDGDNFHAKAKYTSIDGYKNFSVDDKILIKETGQAPKTSFNKAASGVGFNANFTATADGYKNKTTQHQLNTEGINIIDESGYDVIKDLWDNEIKPATKTNLYPDGFFKDVNVVKRNIPHIDRGEENSYIPGKIVIQYEDGLASAAVRSTYLNENGEVTGALITLQGNLSPSETFYFINIAMHELSAISFRTDKNTNTDISVFNSSPVNQLPEISGKDEALIKSVYSRPNSWNANDNSR